MNTHRSVACLLVLILVTTAGPSLAKKKKKGVSTEPGTYTEWQEDIDHLEILSKFELSSYKKIYVREFDSSKTELPDRDDNTYEPVKEVLADPEPPFIQGLGKELSGIKVEAGKGRDGLVVKGTVLKLNPGSRAARYWGGFGAGAAETQLRLEVTDGETGKVLLRVTQERRSGFGIGGGNYVKLMQRNLREIGEDLALVLSAF